METWNFTIKIKKYVWIKAMLLVVLGFPACFIIPAVVAIHKRRLISMPDSYKKRKLENSIANEQGLRSDLAMCWKSLKELITNKESK